MSTRDLPGSGGHPSASPTRAETSGSPFAVTLGCARLITVTFTDAYVSNGRRSISATVTGPGRVGACPFDRLYVEIKEQHGGSGEASSWASRVVRGVRLPLTGKASAALRAELDRAIARHGFHDAWVAAWTAGRAEEQLQSNVADAVTARRVADWCDAAALVCDQMGMGLLSVVPIRAADADRLPRVDVPDTRNGWNHVTWALAVFELHDDERQVGWITDDGRVVPTSVRLR